MRLLVLIFSLAFSNAIVASNTPAPLLIYVRINDLIAPDLLQKKYEDPLHEALQAARVGSVNGSGTRYNSENVIIWSELDVELFNVAKGLPLLRKRLAMLQVPAGSYIEYTLDNQLKRESIP